VRAWAAAALASLGMAGTVLATGAAEALPSPSRGLRSVQVSGIVVDADGPVGGATVRVQGTRRSTLTGADGRFSLGSLPAGSPVTISAWAPLYYCGKREDVVPPQAGLVLTLERYQTDDNPAYTWIAPVGPGSCASCKSGGVARVWLESDQHARSATNPRFLTMYKGTDVLGNQSPPTRYRCDRDYGCVALRPDPTRPYYGPGYKLDFPTTSGNCAACHTPGAAVDRPYGTDPTAVQGADLHGIHCDFCHKIADVVLNPTTGRPFPNRPGVLSLDVRRPFPGGPQLFFGTFDDVNAEAGDTFLPLQGESRFCAPCHSASFWGTIVYDSFGEWLSSPYSDPGYPGAMTCQQCHMPAPTIIDGRPLSNVAPANGGIERNPLAIHAHTFPGAASVSLLQNAARLYASARPAGGRIEVDVSVVNDRTGHHLPTDSPLRQVILLVRGRDGAGQPLTLLAGPTLPDWLGIGDPTRGYYAGLPGMVYAKVLRELWTGIAPTGAYWNPTTIEADTRIPALAQVSATFVFAAPAGQADVEVLLLFRRAFRSLADQKAWDDPDIVMARSRLSLGGLGRPLEP
jgi:hypothetical protein